MDNSTNKGNKILLYFVLGILLVLTLFIIGRDLYSRYYWDLSLETRAFLPEPDPCYVPFGYLADGGVNLTVRVWEDDNSNGQMEPDETPLPNARAMIVYNGYNYDLKNPPESLEDFTDANGRIDLFEFVPGCACNCWRGYAVVSWPPPGYLPTTSTMVSLNKDKQVIFVGFRESK